MRIVICGSMSSAEKMLEIGKELEKIGHICELPRHTKEYAEGSIQTENNHESTENKIKFDLIRSYYKKIGEADAVLIVNASKNGITNYIGGNSFLEMGFAHILNKKVFFFNPIPEMIYTDEIKAMQPIILNGDLTKIA